MDKGDRSYFDLIDFFISRFSSRRTLYSSSPSRMTTGGGEARPVHEGEAGDFTLRPGPRWTVFIIYIS